MVANSDTMKRCTYCGREYDDTATVCVTDQQPLVQVLPSSEVGSKEPNPSVEFLRLFFESPKEEDFAVRCAQFLARIVGERITELRPDTKWSEIVEWGGPSLMGAGLLGAALTKEFGADPMQFLANSEFMTFRDFVEYVCSRGHND